MLFRVVLYMPDKIFTRRDIGKIIKGALEYLIQIFS
jgi:hypothetical protein